MKYKGLTCHTIMKHCEKWLIKSQEVENKNQNKKREILKRIIQRDNVLRSSSDDCRNDIQKQKKIKIKINKIYIF